MLTDRTAPTPHAQQRAKILRQSQTPGEKMLWMENLILEIDGSSHWEPGAQEHDREREAILRSLGFRILRFTNLETV